MPPSDRISYLEIVSKYTFASEGLAVVLGLIAERIWPDNMAWLVAMCVGGLLGLVLVRCRNQNAKT